MRLLLARGQGSIKLRQSRGQRLETRALDTNTNQLIRCGRTPRRQPTSNAAAELEYLQHRSVSPLQNALGTHYDISVFSQ
tara:strand:- start:271 stop:510 length:240 start_codon:yes stop_codon:yes gene_type:complete